MSQRTYQKKLRLEHLEAKTVLAGNVVANVVNGSLVVTGDVEDNVIAIAAGDEPGEFVIASVDTTINGSTDIFVAFSGVTKDIKVNLGAGNDTISVISELPRHLILDGGEGDDEFNLGIGGNALGPVSVTGNVAINGGDGNDLVQAGDLTVQGDLMFDGGIGDDEFFLQLGQFAPSTIDGDVVVVTGSGNDGVGVESAAVGSNLVIDTGSGDDAVAVAEVQVGGSTLALLGSGTNEAQIAAVDAGATLTVLGSGSNTIVLAEVDASLLVSIVTANGNDIVDLEVVNSAAATITSGGGNDAVAIRDSAFALLNVSLGAGDDELELSNVIVEALALIYGNSGVDTLILGDNDINLGWAFSFEDVQNV